LPRHDHQLDAQGIEQFADGFIAGLGTGRERLIQTFTPYACCFGHLGDAACTRNVAECCNKNIGVGIIERGRKVMRDGGFVD